MGKPTIEFPDSVASRQFVYELFESMVATLTSRHGSPGVDEFRRQVAATPFCIPCIPIQEHEWNPRDCP
jgi:hypothetical protein